MPKLTHLLLCLPLLLALTACTSAANPTPTPTTASHVELDVFSGLPNPAWDLPPAGTAALLAMIGALPPSPPVSLPTPLGYRGFLVTIADTSSASAVTLRVYRGIVEYQGPKTAYYSDPMKQVERWLLSSSRPHIDAQLYDSVLLEIERQ
jgi:hypothetical protein